jgi:hypothetical protein
LGAGLPPSARLQVAASRCLPMMCIIVGTNLHESARILGFGTHLDFASFRANSARFVASPQGSIPGASTNIAAGNGFRRDFSFPCAADVP